MPAAPGGAPGVRAKSMWMMLPDKSWKAPCNESRHTHEWVMSHTCMSHVMYMKESRHTRVSSRQKVYGEYCLINHRKCPGMSHVTHMHESRRTCERVTSHKNAFAPKSMWMVLLDKSCKALRYESCHTHWWVKSHNGCVKLHIWRSHVTQECVRTKNHVDDVAW